MLQEVREGALVTMYLGRLPRGGDCEIDLE